MISHFLEQPARAFQREAADRQIGIWLLAVALMVVVMVLVGGLTRLTESGLSITEWRPITGALPPLDGKAWGEEFAKYQATPQFQTVNHAMTLEEFRFIYFWEWAHRLLGRLIGLAFAVPALIFIAQGKMTWRDAPRMGLLFLLGGAQGALGWWMVQSGLVDRVNVSQYRLAAHLGLALIIFAALFWTALERLDLGKQVKPVYSARAQGAGGSLYLPATILVLTLAYCQILMGAIVAGLRAGLVHNTFPLMDGNLLPEAFGNPDLLSWRMVLEDPSLAQFAHRMGAYILLASIGCLWFLLRRHPVPQTQQRVTMVAFIASMQVGLGIWTLLGQVQIPVAAAHQFGAVALLTSLLWLAHSLRPR